MNGRGFCSDWRDKSSIRFWIMQVFSNLFRNLYLVFMSNYSIFWNSFLLQLKLKIILA
jgi:hypothetical protein